MGVGEGVWVNPRVMRYRGLFNLDVPRDVEARVGQQRVAAVLQLRRVDRVLLKRQGNSRRSVHDRDANEPPYIIHLDKFSTV